MTESGIPTAMAVGDQRTITVRARDRWNTTGIQVTAGQVFTLSAKGTWTDLNIDSTPDGYEISSVPSALSRTVLRLGLPFLRCRKARYFCLIGSIGRSREARVAIGSHFPDWKATADGELLCFANDVAVAYGNNEGSVSLEVRRTS
jgi:hypothetical protein